MKNELYFLFKLKRNVYEKRTSFKGNVSVFICRNAPFVLEEEKPYSRRWSGLTLGLTYQTFSDVWMYMLGRAHLSPNKHAKGKATQGPKWIWSIWITSFKKKSFESISLMSLSACHCITWTIWNLYFLHPCKMLCEIYMLYLLGFIGHIVCVVNLASKKPLQR